MPGPADWFYVPRPAPDGRPRLYCFPHAGGGAASYRAWAAPLADLVELVAVRPPGRESRLAEAPLPDVARLAEEATSALVLHLASDPDRPFALLGHSLGAIVAFEVTRALQRRGARAPVGLFVSGSRAPAAPRRERPVAGLPREELVRELATLAGTPAEVLANEELMDLLLPMLRADFAASETYARAPGDGVAVPVFAYGGRGDAEVPAAMVERWAEETTAGHALRLFDGGHFFIHSEKDAFLAALRADLATALSVRHAA